MSKGIDAIDNDGLNCWKHNGNSNSPYSQRSWCEECQKWYDDCPCDSEVLSDVRGKSFSDVLKEKEK